MEGIDDFTLVKNRVRNVGGKEVIKATFKKDEETIYIERFDDIEKTFANTYINDKVTSINSLFLPQDAPYPGVITKHQVCPKEFHPLYNESIEDDSRKVIYEIFSNERFTYGICSEDLIAYNAILSYLYCDTTKKLFTFEIFIPYSPDNTSKIPKSLISSLSCA